MDEGELIPEFLQRWSLALMV
eukprot:SAG22_NODE_13409_length_407_cov_40.350649_1_plen_20_part_01